MAGKTKFHPLNGPHTSGIFSDMSVDGPEIGTLVVIVDRAKNLPNRKTIGKQDPYCAARLGKEAKKTTTDVRGGQTPKWDQELRFTVHDSPDYYQLKLSVFNDDRKTDLIGETWIDLKGIIVSGGGQADVWRSLNCRGKYSGEIRIEITFYDARGKPERAAAAAAERLQTGRLNGIAEPAAEPDGRGSIRAIKRRPLPTDPPSTAHPQNHDGHTSLRERPSYPGPARQASQPALRNQRSGYDYYYPPPPVPAVAPPSYPDPAVAPDPVSAPGPASAPAPGPASGPAPALAPALALGSGPAPPPRKMSHSRSADHFAAPAPAPPARYPAYPHPSTSGLYGAYIYDESRHELHLDSDRPPPPPVHRTRHSITTGPVSHEVVLRNGHHDPSVTTMQRMRHDVLRNEAHRQSVSGHGARAAALPPPPPPQPPQPTLRPQRSLQPTVEDAPESPMTLSQASFSTPDGLKRASQRSSLMYEAGSPVPPYDKTATPAPLNLGSKRASLPPSSPQVSASTSSQAIPADAPGYEPSPDYETGRYVEQGRRQMYEDSRSTHSSAPPAPPARRGSFVETGHEPHHQSHSGQYGSGPVGLPLVPAGRGSRGEQPPPPSDSRDHRGYSPVPPPVRRGSFMEDGYDSAHSAHAHSPAPAPPARRGSFIEEGYNSGGRSPGVGSRRGSFVDNNAMMQRPKRRDSAYESYENALVHVPSVPPSLVPGLDPEFAQEIADRIYEETRASSRNGGHGDASQQYAMVPATRGRARTETYARYERAASPAPMPYTPTGSYGAPSPVYGSYGSVSHSPVPSPSQSHHHHHQHQRHDSHGHGHGHGHSHSNGSSGNGHSYSRGPSPHPDTPGAATHRIPRKSVSPAPSPGFPSDGAGAGASGGSGVVPFGPDSFDALNPSSRGSSARPEADSKIIAPDGREIDPSDHLPIESWAPEPDSRSKPQQPHGRPALIGAQPMPASHPSSSSATGRRRLRIAQRPHSVTTASASPPAYVQPDEQRASPGLPPAAAGRSRLQRKSQRSMTSLQSPIAATAPATPTHAAYQGDGASPRSVPRTTTWDYHSPSEGAAPGYGTSPGASGVSSHRQTLSGPPVPARASPQQQHQQHQHQHQPPHYQSPHSRPDPGMGVNTGGDDWALMQEISRIDLGTGRSRRHGRY